MINPNRKECVHMSRKALLVLEDGYIAQGYFFTQPKRVFGEVVFNTGMTGYQEVVTDPSYCGQIVNFTYPLIGNYGIIAGDSQAEVPALSAILVREYVDDYSNSRASSSLGDFLNLYNIPGISGIDTRALTRHICTRGALRGIIASSDEDHQTVLDEVRKTPGISSRDLVSRVTCQKAYDIAASVNQARYRIAVLDLGAKKGILKSLREYGCMVGVFPGFTSSKELLFWKPDGIVISNGPGDPSAVGYAIKTVKELLGKKPMFGICMGHQILAHAVGYETEKLKYGHRGPNHPVKNILTGQVDITSQNHGFCVKIPDNNGSGSGTVISQINLHDNTIEGLDNSELKFFSVQYHPEGDPGPNDSRYLFKKFFELIDKK